ncbi:MAG: primosomal protein N' [Clostridiales bacterium]
MNFAEVYINKKIATLDHTFVYEIPPELLNKVKIGSVVAVPFGHTSVRAVVTALKDNPGEFKAKYIDKIVNEEFLFPKDLLLLANFIADYYMNTTMSVLRGMIPRGIDIFGKIQKPKTQTWLKLNKIAPLESLKGAKQREFYKYILENQEISQKDAISTQNFSISAINSLTEKEYIIKYNRDIKRYSYSNTASGKTQDFTLTTEQNIALKSILTRDNQDKRPILLHGVTGSGKTEIYLRLAKKMCAENKQTIILIPEIALTPQFIGIFEETFPHEVALMHSGLSSGERRDAWYAAREGTAKIILGPRSAIFAPTQNLGLIIMDEEHEDSYEQENTPQFHTREVAIERCRLTGAMMLMGSATPSFESYYKAKNGEYQLITMENRVDGSTLPLVETVDMREELAQGWTEVLSRSLIAEIKTTLAQKNQVMLFLNRLGTKTFVSCRDCGFVYKCPHCDISLVYYQNTHKLKCNRCNYETPMETLCPQCKSKRIRYFGLGTDGLEKVVRQHFPQGKIARLDSDSTRLKGEFDAIYKKVKNGEIDILLGTKMVAKGWDFPNITLIGIIAADLTLNFPDFRAEEHTFQSITQVAGRCGRGEAMGKVILQTYRPDEKVLKLAANQDYPCFFAWEQKKRETYGYPPYCEIIKVIFTTPKGYFFEKDLKDIKKVFQDLEDNDFTVLGPVPGVYRYQKNQEKWVLTLMGKNILIMKTKLKEGLSTLNSENIADRNIRIQTEVNPVHIV